MTPENFYRRIVEPTLQYMAASPTVAIPVTDAARVLVTAIAGQESGWQHRRQLGIGDKPCAFLDVEGFYTPLMGMIDHMIAEKFLPAAHRDGVVVEGDPIAMINKLINFQPVTVAKWL